LGQRKHGRLQLLLHSSGIFKATFDTRNIAAGSSDSFSLSLPRFTWLNTYNATIAWGDGTTSTVTYGNDPDFDHTYAAEGVYQILITGIFPAMSFGPSNDKLKILSVDDWGNGDYYFVDNTTEHFQNCVNLTLSSVLGVPNLGNDMSSMFTGCAGLTTINNVNQWDTSGVTQRMSQTFYQATNFNDDLNNWDVSNVIDFGVMFGSTASFNGNINGWVFKAGTNMGSMFNGATAFNQDISSWDLSLITSQDLAGMFSNATSFNQDLSGWCVTNITSEPSSFSIGATAWVLPKPVWGTCP